MKLSAKTLLVFSMVLLGLPGFSACSSHKGEKEKPDQHVHESENSEHAEASCLDRTIPDLLAMQCEHNIPTHQCDECRYETGIVKVVPSLLKQNGGLVGITKADRMTPNRFISLTGEVHPSDGLTVHLAPRVSGVIRSIRADLGQSVQAGQTLFEIDSMELGEAKSDYLQKKALFDLAKQNFAREERLHQAKVGTGQELAAARTERQGREIELRASQEKLMRLGLSSLEIQALHPGALSGTAGYLKVCAPSHGTVLERHAAIGEIVDPQREVMQIADLSKVWVWLDIRSQEMAQILQAQRRAALGVEVTVSAYPDKVFKGKLDFAGGTVDEGSRTLKARATVRNIGNLLRPGMFCTVRVALPQGNKVIAVPQNAVLTDAGRRFVFIHLKDDYYISRPVEVGATFGDYLEIKRGVAPQDAIVENGSFLLKSDMLRSKMGAGCAD